MKQSVKEYPNHSSSGKPLSAWSCLDSWATTRLSVVVTKLMFSYLSASVHAPVSSM